MALNLNIKKLEAHEQKIIADAHQYSAADLLIREATVLRDRIRDENESLPRRSPDDLTDDWVFKAGVVHALNAVINAPEQADAHIKARST